MMLIDDAKERTQLLVQNAKKIPAQNMKAIARKLLERYDGLVGVIFRTHFPTFLRLVTLVLYTHAHI